MPQLPHHLIAGIVFSFILVELALRGCSWKQRLLAFSTGVTIATLMDLDHVLIALLLYPESFSVLVSDPIGFYDLLPTISSSFYMAYHTFTTVTLGAISSKQARHIKILLIGNIMFHWMLDMIFNILVPYFLGIWCSFYYSSLLWWFFFWSIPLVRGFQVFCTFMIALVFVALLYAIGFRLAELCSLL